ncbi:efflux RND transporter permease subunit, partial [Acinetobacter baumannii]|nr:efflux RND transporter permease subunit [Acinetobacter baumannii]
LALVWFIQWPTTFLPEEDDGYFLVAVQLPPAASLERTCRVGEQLDSLLATYPEVETYLGVNGFSIMGGGKLSNAATYFVVLKDWKD